MATPLISNDIVVLGLVAATLGAVFWTASSRNATLRKFYSVVPPLLPWCPTLSTSQGKPA